MDSNNAATGLYKNSFLKKIDFLIGENPYSSTVYFAKSLSEALTQKGVATRLFWVGEGHFFHAFYEIMADPPDLTCSFSDISMNRQKSLGECWQIPHLSYLVDPAIYFLHQLKGENSWIACADEGDVHFMRSFTDSRTFFLPHGADPKHLCSVHADRLFDVVFLGSCIDYEQVERRWKIDYSSQIQALLHQASSQVLSPTGVSILSALKELNASQIDLPLLHHEVDLYTRGKDRVELLRSLKGQHIHIWGKGPWQKYLTHATIHPPIAFDKALEVMKRAKVVLNSSPRFKQGLHERILYPLICGACVLTGASSFLNKHFVDQEHLLTYRYGEWDSNLSDLMSKRAEIAAKGQQKALTHHSWDCRATTLLNFLLNHLS